MLKTINKKREVDAQPSPLKLLRRRAELTQDQLARLLRVSTRAVQAWEGGEYQPTLTIPQIKTLCRALNCTLEELPDDVGTPRRSLEKND
jgi:DNA-binding XRE family transcriptional regulator